MAAVFQPSSTTTMLIDSHPSQSICTSVTTIQPTLLHNHHTHSFSTPSQPKCNSVTTSSPTLCRSTRRRNSWMNYCKVEVVGEIVHGFAARWQDLEEDTHFFFLSFQIFRFSKFHHCVFFSNFLRVGFLHMNKVCLLVQVHHPPTILYIFSSF